MFVPVKKFDLQQLSFFMHLSMMPAFVMPLQG